MEEAVRSGDEVAVAVIDHDLDAAGVRRAERSMRNLGTALAHTVVVDATRVRHVGARGLLLLDHWVHQWQHLNLKVKILASHHLARAVGAAGGDHVVHVTFAAHPEEAPADNGDETPEE